MSRRRWALRLFAFLLVVNCPALRAVEREYFFDRLDNEDGLLQNSVLAMMQSSDGYMWISTQGALHRFDGYGFKVFEHDGEDSKSVPDSVINALAEDVDKRLWIGTNAGGVGRFDPATDTFESFALAASAPAGQHRAAAQGGVCHP